MYAAMSETKDDFYGFARQIICVFFFFTMLSSNIVYLEFPTKFERIQSTIQQTTFVN